MKKIIISVADLDVIDLESGEKALSSKTMVNTGMNVSVANDVLRGGKGNMPIYVFNHDKNMEVNATDVCYNLEYFAINNGSVITQGANYFGKETVDITNGNGTVSKVPFKAGEETSYGYVSYGNVVDEKVAFNTQDFTLADTTFTGKACIQYFRDEMNAKEVKIYADVKLKTYKLIYHIDIGLQSEGVDGKTSIAPFGKLQVIVEKAQPTGNWELTLASDAASQSQLNFIALATEGAVEGCSATAGVLARVVEYTESANWYDEVVDLIASVDGSDSISVTTGQSVTLNVRALTKSGKIIYLNTQDALSYLTAATSADAIATVQGATVNGVAVGTAEITYSITAVPEVNTFAKVTVAA